MLKNPAAEIFIPDGTSPSVALRRTTHMAVAAHADDLEIMAYHGISECFGQGDRWFFGVVLTDGAGSPRSGRYGEYTNEAMRLIRKNEQKKAACIGEYSGIAFLDYSSSELKKSSNSSILTDLVTLFRATRPELLYLHNLMDSHDTHVAAVLQCIAALRQLPHENLPGRVLGCEVWRGLEWLHESDKVRLDVGGLSHLAQALLGVFDSQIRGGKRYDQATLGRRLSNATFDQSHAVDQSDSLTFAADLTSLIKPPYPLPEEWVSEVIEHFQDDVLQRIGLFQSQKG